MKTFNRIPTTSCELFFVAATLLAMAFTAKAAPYLPPLFADQFGDNYYPEAARPYFQPPEHNMMTLGRRPRALIPGSFPMFDEYSSHFRGVQQQQNSTSYYKTSQPRKSYTHQLKPTAASQPQPQPRANMPSFSDDNVLYRNRSPFLNSRQPSISADVPMPPAANDVAPETPALSPPTLAELPPRIESPPPSFARNGPLPPVYGYTPMYTGIADGPGPGPDGYPNSYQMGIVDPYSFRPNFYEGNQGNYYNNNNNYFSQQPTYNSYNNLQQRSIAPTQIPQQQHLQEPLDAPLSPQQNQIESEADRQANDFNWGVSNLPPLNSNQNGGGQFNNNNNNYFRPQPQQSNVMLRNRFNFPMQSHENLFNSYRPDFSAAEPQFREQPQQPQQSYPNYFSNRFAAQQPDTEFMGGSGGGFNPGTMDDKNVYVKRYGNSPYDQSYEVKYGTTFPASSSYYSPPPPPPPEYMQMMRTVPSTQPATSHSVQQASQKPSWSTTRKRSLLKSKTSFPRKLLKQLVYRDGKRQIY